MATLRGLAMPIGVIAAVLLVLLFNPWFVIEGTSASSSPSPSGSASSSC